MQVDWLTWSTVIQIYAVCSRKGEGYIVLLNCARERIILTLLMRLARYQCLATPPALTTTAALAIEQFAVDRYIR